MQKEEQATPPTRPIPTAPPLRFGDEPALSGSIGAELDDFEVRELPLYEFIGEGEHLMLHIEKRGLTTREVVKRLAQWADMSPRDIGYAGMKDKHAVTSQWFSIATPKTPNVQGFGDDCRLLDHTRHQTKLRTGHLKGNRFAIRLRGVDDPARLRERVEEMKARGIPNGFDAQRFGRGGRNLDKALAWAAGRIRRVKPFERKLFASVIQSEAFNRVLCARFASGDAELMEGDVVRLDGSRTLFVVEDLKEAQERLASGDIHLTGPIFGPKMLSAQGEPAEIEAAAVAALELSDEAAHNVGRSGQGTRRDLYLDIGDIELDEEGDGIVLRFALPAGSYATLVVRNALNQPWSIEDGREDNS